VSASPERLQERANDRQRQLKNLGHQGALRSELLVAKEVRRGVSFYDVVALISVLCASLPEMIILYIFVRIFFFS
jgi:hypothetical protein